MRRTQRRRRAQGSALSLLLGVLCVLWSGAESSQGSSGPESQPRISPAVPATKSGGAAGQVQQQTEGKSAQRPRAMSRQELDRLAAERGPLELQLFAAIDRSDVKAVSACLAKGANVNARDETGSTPLHHAARYGQLAIAEVLVANRADVNALNLSWGTPLHCAVLSHGNNMVKLLTRGGADLNLRSPSGTTPLNDAIDCGYSDIVQLLLEAGAPLDIYTAAALGKTDYIEKVVAEDPATVNRKAKTLYGGTALHKAAFYGRMDVVQLLLAHSADANARDSYRATPLHEAVYGGHQEIVRLLLERGADVNAVVTGGTRVGGRVHHEPEDTPLHIAARKGDVAMVKLLLEHRADVKAKNTEVEWVFGMIRPRPKSGLTPLGVALKEGKKEVADLLRQHGATE